MRRSRFVVDSGTILSRMIERGLSQAEAAKLTGVAGSTFSRCLVEGRTVHPKTAAKLVAVFGADVVEISSRP